MDTLLFRKVSNGKNEVTGGYFSLLVEEDLVSELEKLTKERISKEEEGALTDLRKKMISLSANVFPLSASPTLIPDLLPLTN